MINFTKMEGTGNDFILIDNMQESIKYDYKELSQYLCNRNFGVGADGVLFIEDSNIADFKMKIFNKDGSEAEMCGNGIRCFATYLYNTKKVQKTDVQIETKAGIKDIKLIIEGKKVSSVIVNMGIPEFEYKKIPIYYTGEHTLGSIKIENIEVIPVSMGNPHAVCFLADIESVDIEKYGRLIENYKYFPNKTNVEFVQIIDDQNIKVRVWERGVGETLSCGTGACASAVVANQFKGLENRIRVRLKGGNLVIKYNENNKNIWLEGEAKEVFKGKIRI